MCHEPHHHDSSHDTPGRGGGDDPGVGFIQCLGFIDGTACEHNFNRRGVRARTLDIIPDTTCLGALLLVSFASTVRGRGGHGGTLAVGIATSSPKNKKMEGNGIS